MLQPLTPPCGQLLYVYKDHVFLSGLNITCQRMLLKLSKEVFYRCIESPLPGVKFVFLGTTLHISITILKFALS